LNGTAQQTAENLNPSANNNALSTSQTNQTNTPPVVTPPPAGNGNPLQPPTGVIRIVIPQKP
jgi:hypothetical protein